MIGKKSITATVVIEGLVLILATVLIVIVLHPHVEKIFSAGWNTADQLKVHVLIFSKVIVSTKRNLGIVILISYAAENIFGLIDTYSNYREIIEGYIEFIIGGELRLE